MSKEAMKPRMRHQRLYYLVLIGLGIISMIVSQTTQLSNAQAPLLAEVFRAMDWSSDGRFIATARQDGRIEIWDADGQLLRSWQADTVGPIVSLDWHPDPESTLLVSGGADEIVRIWDAETGDLVWQFLDHTDFVTSVFWSPDGREIGSTGFNTRPENVLIWDMETKNLVHSFGARSDLQNGTWSPDGTQIATGGGATIEIWDVDTGDLVTSFTDFQGEVIDVDWDSNSNLLAGAALDSNVRVYDPTTHNLIFTLTEHQDYFVETVKWSPDGSRLASASFDGTVRIWDATTRVQIKVIQTVEDGLISQFAWSPDSTRIAYGRTSDTFDIVPIPT